MQDVQTKAGGALLRSLSQLKEQKGTLSLDDVGGIFMQVASSLTPCAEADQYMHQEIARLANYIANAKKEIFTISSNEKTGTAIVDASQHLDEVIKASEKASHTVMDAAEAIQAATAGMGGEKEKKVTEAINNIYESCNFQDLNGQRITKVIRLLATIEDGIAKLNALFNAGSDTGKAGAAKAAPSDKDLLNGPQLSGAAPSQTEIDALFASLGNKN